MTYVKLFADAAAWHGENIDGPTMEHVEEGIYQASLGAGGSDVGDVKWFPYSSGWSSVWVEANGQAILRATYPALAALAAADSYPDGAGDGSTTFNVPDLTKRFLTGRGDGLTVHDTGGLWNHVHTGPSHSHTGPSHSHGAGAHAHSVGAHSHDLGSHTHSTPVHDHGDGSLSADSGGSHSHTTGGPSSTGSQSAASSGPGPAHTHTVNSGGSHTHGISGSTGNAGGAGTGAASGSTGSSGSGTTGDASGSTDAAGTGNTGAAGTGNTGTANPPWRAGVYLIKAA